MLVHFVTDAPNKIPAIRAMLEPEHAVESRVLGSADQGALSNGVLVVDADLRKALPVEQLKATQQQIASDNSKAIEQLKASQEEMKRQLAAISAQNLSRTPQQNLPRTSPTPAQPTAVLRKPKPRPYPPYERARIPSQWDYEEW